MTWPKRWPRWGFRLWRKCLYAGGKRATSPVIPGWSEGPDPESRDSGFDASHRPGMTVVGLLRGACHRARIRATRWLVMTIRVSLEFHRGIDAGCRRPRRDPRRRRAAA